MLNHQVNPVPPLRRKKGRRSIPDLIMPDIAEQKPVISQTPDLGFQGLAYASSIALQNQGGQVPRK